MTKREYISALSTSSGMGADVVEAVLDIMPQVLTECLLNNSSVAIPRFGTFSSIKEDDYISIDTTSGKSILNPPLLRICFRPSVLLRKKV